MGKIIADSGDGKHEDFLRGVQQMYQGTRNWGSVRLTIKRSKYEILTDNVQSSSRSTHSDKNTTKRGPPSDALKSLEPTASPSDCM